MLNETYYDNVKVMRRGVFRLILFSLLPPLPPLPRYLVQQRGKRNGSKSMIKLPSCLSNYAKKSPAFGLTLTIWNRLPGASSSSFARTDVDGRSTTPLLNAGGKTTGNPSLTRRIISCGKGQKMLILSSNSRIHWVCLPHLYVSVCGLGVPASTVVGSSMRGSCWPP